ncbi:MAG: AI-2E family transporter [Alphaproteobacteria bacterium]|nr:AI-2E family transporter [Alphaproteobacteria bacterium]
MKKHKPLIIVLTAITLIACFFYAISAILLPFVLAFVLAYFLDPLTNKLTRRHWNRSLAAGTVVTGFCVSIVTIFLILVPILQTQILSFMTKAPAIASLVWNKIRVLINYTKHSFSQQQMHQLSDAVNQTAFDVLNSVATGLLNLLSGGVALFNIISLLLITPVVLFYVLKDWNHVSKNIKNLIPSKYKNDVTSIWREINVTLAGFIRGQVSVCLFLAVFYGIGLSLIGLDLGILIGILSGILSFIPYFGFLTGVVLSILVALSQSAGWGLWVGLAVVFIVGQVLESYILTPKLVGENVGLHPVWVIFALMAGGVLFGFLGILVAVPVAAVIGVLVRRAIKWYEQSPVYKDK